MIISKKRKKRNKKREKGRNTNTKHKNKIKTYNQAKDKTSLYYCCKCKIFKLKGTMPARTHAQ